jgi:hypothetical protein
MHNKGVYKFYFSLNIVWVITLRRMRRMGYAARMGKMRNAYKNIGKHKRESHVAAGIDGKIPSKWIIV